MASWMSSKVSSPLVSRLDEGLLHYLDLGNVADDDDRAMGDVELFADRLRGHEAPPVQGGDEKLPLRGPSRLMEL